MSDSRPGLVFVTGPESEVRARTIAKHRDFEYVTQPDTLTDYAWHTEYAEKEEVMDAAATRRRRLTNTTAYLGRFTKLLVSLEGKDDPSKIYITSTDLFSSDLLDVEESSRNIMSPVFKGLRRGYKVAHVWVKKDEEDLRLDPKSESYVDTLKCENMVKEGIFFSNQSEGVYENLTGLATFYGLHLKTDSVSVDEIRKIADEKGLEKVWINGKEDYDVSFYLAVDSILNDVGVVVDNSTDSILDGGLGLAKKDAVTQARIDAGGAIRPTTGSGASAGSDGAGTGDTSGSGSNGATDGGNGLTSEDVDRSYVRGISQWLDPDFNPKESENVSPNDNREDNDGQGC